MTLNNNLQTELKATTIASLLEKPHVCLVSCRSYEHQFISGKTGYFSFFFICSCSVCVHVTMSGELVYLLRQTQTV